LFSDIAAFDERGADGFEIAGSNRGIQNVWLLTLGKNALTYPLDAAAVARAAHRQISNSTGARHTGQRLNAIHELVKEGRASFDLCIFLVGRRDFHSQNVRGIHAEIGPKQFDKAAYH